MKDIVKIQTYIIYSHNLKKHYVEFFIQIKNEKLESYNIHETCKALSISNKTFVNYVHKSKGHVDQWIDRAYFDNKQDAQEFLEELTPYFVMLKLTS